MPFSAVASHSADKIPDMYVQGYEELGSDFFDQFLTFSPAEAETGDYPLPESTLMKRAKSHFEDASLTSTDDKRKRVVALEDSRQGESWAMEQRTLKASYSTSTDQFCASGRAASDSELLSLEGIYLDSPQLPAHTQTSLPTSPTQVPVSTLRRKNRIVGSLSRTFNRGASSLDKSALRSPIRKAKSIPAMMQNSNQNNNSFDLWGQKLDLDAAKFNFDFEQDDAPLSPRSSARVPDVLQFSDAYDDQNGELLDGMSYKHALTQHFVRPTPYDTPLSTPTLDRFPSRQTSQQLRLDSALFPVTPQAPHASSSWSQLPGSPDFNTYGNSTLYPEIDPPIWWNHAATAPLAQPSPNNFQTNPQRATKSLALQLQNDLAFDNNEMGYNASGIPNGLMIQMPDTSAQQSFVLSSPPMLPPQGYFPTPHSQPHQQQHHQHPQQHHQQHHHQRPNHNRQASHHAQSRHPQQSSPIRKSRSGSSDSESPSPSCSTPAGFSVRKRKTPKTSKQSTPRTPNTGAVDFVNYTPSDSRKILTGVAPSGSSKTKARREKEALDKRRKLSQAALRAVRAAGGDVDSLVEQGLFV
ncbi:hypothetical protein ONS95_006030 [Cadophora gregata]|uniref:uncharacterized protein n=1 Tax=Cadophora gregata TaxID=51156 RepID=UPI0026DB11EE|nr:uncharacterized protein ONS95_006030 [Cadophora gregata]KAK0102410.1 hypothetical protein ONS95_006030 [Cadophora gregata]KAK0104034.1 hypothetical protein ONS96_005139 [Cadophora gregata f. sp. sojae]